MLKRLKRWFSSAPRDAELHGRLAELRHKAPVPVFWLFGKTQSGKTSAIKYLTGAEEAEIGHGFKPCTRFSREYDFPSEEAPLLVFLDTRGMDEPGYDPTEDLAKFGDRAHIILVTVRLLDHALENILRHLRTIRLKERHRPIILAVTCLHEAYPQQQHPQPYPFDNDDWTKSESLPSGLVRSLIEQRARFAGLCDHFVPIDLTPPAEGFVEPNYGGPHLKHMLLQALPAAFRQTILQLDEVTSDLQDLYARHALPHILGYSSLAATAGAIPVPWVDLVILPAIQSRMVFHLARFYGQPLSGQRFLELAGSLCMGMLVRQASREVAKFIPFFGSVASGALAGAATFALGKAFCFYFSAVHKGHTPKPEDLKRYYEQQLAQAEKFWKKKPTRT